MALLYYDSSCRSYYLYELAWFRYEGIFGVFFDLSYQIYCWYELNYIGNYSENKLTVYDNYIVTIAPAANFLMFFIFYLVWKAHFFKCIADQEEDNSDVKPDKFCL